MTNKVKERLASHIDGIEKINATVKKLVEEIKGIEKSVQDASDVNIQKNLCTEHFALVQYQSLLIADLNKLMHRVAECYLTSVILGVELELSEEELKIVEGYTKNSENIFVIDKGEVQSRRPDLLKIMKEKSLSLKEAPFIDNYIKSLLV
jgi:hypothetical protein